MKNTEFLDLETSSSSDFSDIGSVITTITTPTKARRLKVIAEWINIHLSFNGYRAEVKRSFSNTDRQLKGTRLIRRGKGRRGNEIKIYKNNTLVHSHNSAETYKRNEEVEEWLGWELKKIGFN